MEKEYDVTVEWRGFELHPEIPVGGMDLSAMFPAEQIEMFRHSIKNLAEQQGVGEMVMSKRSPNTRAALAVAEYARDEGKLFVFKEAAMQAYWRDGEDIEDEVVLSKILVGVELDVTAGLAAQKDVTYLARVDAMRDEAHKAGVTGIPTMIFENGGAIVGAQRWEVFEDIAQKAGAKRR